jgi:haloalkane dehalogenase
MSTAQSTLTGSRTLTPVQDTRPAWLDDAVYPFQSHFLNLDGHRIHYIDEGNGPTLLFLHANLLWSFQYRHIIEPLRARFRCIALDYPGFGLSEARPGFIMTLADHSNLVEHFIHALYLNEITAPAQDQRPHDI